jgi:large subunit ribosomal protein L28
MLGRGKARAGGARSARRQATTRAVAPVVHPPALPSTRARAEQAGGGQQHTGKRKLHARNVSHSNIKTMRWQHVNIQERRLWVPELGRHVALKVTTSDLRTIDKVGLLAYAKRHGVKLS